MIDAAGLRAIGFADTPRWSPHVIDTVNERVQLVERDEAAFRAASFLDARSVTPETRRDVATWADLAAALPADARRDVQYIFHIGHVGSTLIARLLGELPSVFALREPMVLRGLAEMAKLHGLPESPWPPEALDDRIAIVTALLSRTFRPEQRALVKATSYVSDLAPKLVPPTARTLLLYAPPEAYLANILAGEASRAELHAFAPTRVQRLNRRVGEPRVRLWELDEAERAALGWACEMTSLRIAALALAERALWLEFDAFLADPASGLAQLAAFFGADAPPAQLQALAAGPIMGRYAKAPEHAYTPDLRRQVLAASLNENRAAIRRAMAWLERAAANDPLLAECLTGGG